MNIELSRFRVKEGKSEVVDQWLAFLNENMEEVSMIPWHIRNVMTKD